MGWDSRSNPALVDAVVASFSESREAALTRLSQFIPRDWARTEFWLDTSGLALYFLDLVQSRELSDAVDARVLRSLQQKRADNQVRVADMLQEFVAINRSFQEAGLCYANLKGFTLIPDSCSDPSLRHQSDYDFLVDPDHLEVSRSLLEKRGYRLTGSTARSLEFKASGMVRTSLDGQYRTSTRRSAELHIGIESLSAVEQKAERDPRLDRLHCWRWEAECFPALSPADQWISQALHLLGHLCNEHTRPSWLLEFRRHAIARREDSDFWIAVRMRVGAHAEAALALGLSTLLATDLFGPFVSPDFAAWTVDRLAPRVRLWTERYGRRAALADVPGTKLYLLLEDALQDTRVGNAHERIRRLIPLRRPDRMLQAPPRESLPSRIRREVIELRFMLFRLRFHVKQAILLTLEARQWKRLSTLDKDTLQPRSRCNCSPGPE